VLRSEAICFLRNWLVHCRQRGYVAALRLNGCFHRWIHLWHSHLRSSNIRPALAVTGVLSLLPFFEFFRGTPHQLAAIKQLEESMPAELLEEHEADWFQAWKESGYDQQIYMPYFRQWDNKTKTGYRECFSSAAAMVAAFYKRVKTDDEYNEIRAQFGDTTSVDAQLLALGTLGLKAEFRKDGHADLVEQELEAGRPVLVGWLHVGNILLGERPTCNAFSCGHWSVISGYAGKNSSDPEWIMQDPRGFPEMEKGGHSNPHLGRNVRVRQAAFHQRWQADGPKTGWVILVSE
tara:strand:+ start:203 stop:1075 length:873 start_codon:yes stop_codon:yes gene_type:complete